MNCPHCNVPLKQRNSPRLWDHPEPHCEGWTAEGTQAKYARFYNAANAKALDRQRTKEALRRRSQFDTGPNRFVFQVIHSGNEKRLCLNMAGVLERDAIALTSTAHLVTATMASLIFSDDAEARLRTISEQWFEYGLLHRTSEDASTCVVGKIEDGRILGLSYDSPCCLVEFWYVGC